MRPKNLTKNRNLGHQDDSISFKFNSLFAVRLCNVPIPTSTQKAYIESEMALSTNK